MADDPARHDGASTDEPRHDSGGEVAIDDGLRAEGIDDVRDDDGAEVGEPAAADRKRKRKGNHRKPKKPKPFWVEALVLVVIAVAIAVGVHTFFFQAYFIPSGSMRNTLQIGDRVLVNKMSYKVGHPQRGQIIVFNGEDSWDPEVSIKPPSNIFDRVGRDISSYMGFAPSGEKDYIKRIIGVPGDHVQCCDAQGRISVNGVPLNENYLYSGPKDDVVHTTTAVNKPMPFNIIVPPGRLWVEGDHRDNSSDSRAHLSDPGGGTIPESRVVGRAFVVVWPLSHWRGLGIPDGFSSVPDAAVALPYGVGALVAAPIGLLRLRRRRRRRAGPGRARAAGSKRGLRAT